MAHEFLGQLGTYADLSQAQLISVVLVHVSVIIWWSAVGWLV